MQRLVLGVAAVLFSTAVVVAGAPAPAGGGTSPAWNMNATIIEACSCPMFCQCYFNTSPSGEHGAHGEGGHYCRFNNAFKVNRGSFGDVKLDGAKFWVAGDLGGDFSHGLMDWAIVTFDRATSKEQRDAIATIVGSVYPVKWNSLTTAEGDMSWTAGKDEARALLDGGKTAEVSLKRFAGMTDEPVVIRNLKYWGAPRNDGFVLMPNTVEAFRAGSKPFEYKGTNGFMITIDTASKDAGPAPKKAGK
ncbi:MAG: hypothetical protein AUI52_01965 [Acidobacteria bacterium 13_1_40CM_2_68_10]|nr:MAG: hypothetical protein AUI52_01965 [Acidobacteria bacterium 13_1_40CM_2_68_10]OLE65485.1 MAG: hypothetical protein AUG03_04510 [Acidobacteria bacterium 13_1_20CM_2_68_14]